MSSSATSATASATTSAKGLVDSAANPSFKIVGICLAVGSGLLIGASFVIKKKGLIQSTQKYGNKAGEGHAYLKSWLWWAGMITMILGEVCNFVAYAFTEAILVTPMGALSVVVAAILSHFILKEKLTFFGWIGCTLCIMGAVILALNAPEQQSVTTINGFKHFFLSVGFLVWISLLIAFSLVLVFWAAPRWGKKSMLPYISICSLIGGISVSCTQGLGASIVTSIQGNNQVKNWFFWFLFVFVVITLLTEINYLNKALELFNTSMVVPVYFCFFSSATLITSFILYQGLKASAVTLITMVLGFLVTCLGITLLQLSKVDPNTLDKLDRKSTILMQAAQHQTEDSEKGQVSALEDPGMDALRGGFGAVGSIIRARSVSRRISNASTLGGRPMYSHDSGNLSTHGLGNLQRYQLSDGPIHDPMPSDAMDHISLHSAKSPNQPNFPTSYFPSPRGSRSQIKFEEADVVHQYHYGHTPDQDATHTTRPAINPLSPGRSFSGDATGGHGGFSSHIPFLNHRQPSTGSMYPPVMEEDEDLAEKEADKDNETRSYTHSAVLTEEPSSIPLPSRNTSDPYAPYQHPGAGFEQDPQNAKNLHSGHRGLSGLFQFHSGPDLSLHIQNKIRSRSKDGGTSEKREKDFPHSHLSKKNRDEALEREERTALVVRSDEESGGEETKEDEEALKSAVSAVGHEKIATLGAATRVQLNQPTSQPMGQSRSGGGSGLIGPRGMGQAKGKMPDSSGFVAGPRYGS
ncbi:hypothetical protein IAR55_004122 [Kwoniella newhampshirensis]|uniref:DUF803-domain-containing protein n=1 Tax=Kwoniella newhampshirensis TaxID=1651941 RepID=A0AAW0YR12_9TREE